STGAYTDTAFLFLLSALDLARPGGRIMLIQPQSIAAARDATGIRSAVRAAAAISGMWTCDELIFDANVRVCAPLVVRGGVQPREVRRWCGRAFDESPLVRAPNGSSWSTLLAHRNAPPPVVIDSNACLSELATATAGFRDQFYGLASHVVDRAEADERDWP